jgi:hypothetical protein
MVRLAQPALLSLLGESGRTEARLQPMLVAVNFPAVGWEL